MEEKLTKEEWELKHREKLYEKIFAEVCATHSERLDYINKQLTGLNGYSRFWKFMRGNGGVIATFIGFLTIVGSIWVMPVKIDYRFQSIEKELLNIKNVLQGTSITLKEVGQTLTDYNGRISKLEGILGVKNIK